MPRSYSRLDGLREPKFLLNSSRILARVGEKGLSCN
jgi:hypothetical protein